MAAYRKNASDDRDALFGGMSAGNNPRNGANSGPPRTTSRPPPPSGPPSGVDPMVRLREMKKNQNRRAALPAGPVRDQKLKEAEDYRDKANKIMSKSFFGPKPDPVAASTFYKRAADAYQQLGDMPREERLYRLQSAYCNTLIQAWASVAQDYTRAAVLLEQQMDDNIQDSTIADPALELSQYHQKTADAWTQLGEKSKAAGAQIKAAIALNSGGKTSKTSLSKAALAAMEKAVEAHVPDVFNNFARYREVGHSAFVDTENGETLDKPFPQTLELARQHIVTASYAHEPLQELVHMLVSQYREFPTALYAAGAASYLLENDGNSTISCSRMYVSETILLLAMGDAVAAQEEFMNRHCQKLFYLQSRECKLAEELFRAVLNRDVDGLEEARSPAGDNKAALANLHSSLRQLVTELRIAGVARKNKPAEIQEAPSHDSSESSRSDKRGSRQKKGPSRGGGPSRQHGGGDGPPPSRQHGGGDGPPPSRQHGGGGGPPPSRSGGGPSRQHSDGPPPSRQHSDGPPPSRQHSAGPPSSRQHGGGGGGSRNPNGGPPPMQHRPQNASFQELANMNTGYEEGPMDRNSLPEDFGGMNIVDGDDDDDDDPRGGRHGHRHYQEDDDDDDVDLR